MRRLLIVTALLAFRAGELSAQFPWPVRGPSQITAAYSHFGLTIGEAVVNKYHSGMDISAAAGLPVQAIAGGLVVKIQQNDVTNITCVNTSTTCEDHGFGNTVIIQHVFAYTQYSHLSSIDPGLIAACGGVDAGRRGRRTCSTPVEVRDGASIGTVGGSGFGKPTYWPSHVHYEQKTFGTLVPGGDDNAEPDGKGFGYRTKLPDEEGYVDPILRFQSERVFLPLPRIRVVNATSLRVGPGASAGSDAPTYRTVRAVNANEVYTALRIAQPTSNPSCTGGWYQLRRTDPSLLIADASQGGAIPHAWLCAQSALGVGDLNDDATVDVRDLGILLSNWGTANWTKDNPSGADMNIDFRVDVIDLGIFLANWNCAKFSCK